MRALTLLAAATLIAAPLTAQEAKPAPKIPDGWKIRADRANADLATLEFVGMPPGWHVTTGPAVILWDPAKTADGNFKLETEVFFFREKSRDTEAYGIFLGGSDLEGPAQEYVYFVLRNDGAFLIKQRVGADTRNIQDWTPHEAVAKHTGTGATVKNILTVTAGADQVAFAVNGKQVAAFPRAQLRVDGLVGLRVNHALNLHFTRLDVTK